jgi:hypothetical protein
VRVRNVKLGSLASALFVTATLLAVLGSATSAGAATPASSTALKNDKPVSVTVGSSGVEFSFTAVAGQHLTLAITKPVTSPAGSCVQMIVTDSSNNQDAADEFSTTPTDINFTPSNAQAGLTTVEIVPDGYACTAATSATMTLTYATDVKGSLTSGVAVPVKLSYEGQNASFSFEGVAGLHVTIDVTNPITAPVDSCYQIYATNVNNAEYADSEFNTSETDINFTPSESGLVTVTLTTDGYACTAASTGTFTLTYAKDVTGALTSGAAKKVHLKYLGQNAEFTFSAPEGTAVSLEVSDPVDSPSGSCYGIYLTDESGNTYTNSEFGNSSITVTTTTPEPGTNYVAITPDGYACTSAYAGKFTLTYTAGSSS